MWMQWPNPKIFKWSIILFFKILKHEKQVHVQTFWQILNNLLEILRSFVKHQIFIDCIFDFPLVCPIFVFFLRIRVHFLLGFPVKKEKKEIKKCLKTKKIRIRDYIIPSLLLMNKCNLERFYLIHTWKFDLEITLNYMMRFSLYLTLDCLPAVHVLHVEIPTDLNILFMIYVH